MFDKLKQAKKIKELQDNLAKERVEIEESGVKVVANGKMEIEEIKLNGDLEREENERAVKEGVNKAMREVQKIAAKSFSQMKDLNL